VDSFFKNEDISHYAQRLSARIEPNSILIGLSFGGIVAIEIAKHIPSKIILVSSASILDKFRGYFDCGIGVKLIKFFPRLHS
jgi:esterase/lipase